MTEHDRELSRLYRQTSVETPPAALDAAILKASRDKLAKPARPVRSRWARWMAPAGLVATLVLGVYVTLMVERERPITGELVVERREIRAPADVRVDDAARSAPAAAMVAPPAQRSQKSEPAGSVRPPEVPAPAQVSASREPLAAPPSVAAESAPAAAPVRAGPAATLRSKSTSETPEARLEEIRRLKRDGLDQEAVVRLEAFRKEFPEYPVPKDLAP